MVKKNKRQQNIKTKLIAAICMLLVSSIMMVSSTYAWFTLSTAPEVTGITTAVGANGNLEIALMPKSGSLDDIKSSVGDSLDAAGQTAQNANITWGNLVDLEEGYGLDQIMLYPAALNADVDAAGNPTALRAAMLKTPTYGADGRVIGLLENTKTSIFENNSFASAEADRGVRAVGVASGMTDRQLAYRNSQSAALASVSKAKNAAVTSLTTNGNALAGVAITHGADSSATHSSSDVQALLAITNDLLKADGILGQIENAYLQYIVAYAASSESGLDDTAFATFQSAVAGKTLTEVLDILSDHSISLPSTIQEKITALSTTKTNVSNAAGILDGLKAKDSVTWTELYPALKLLANPDSMSVNGFTPADIKVDMDGFMKAYMADGGLIVSMATGGGVYADVADHCGNYTASVTIAKVEYGDIVNLTDVPATMKTASTVNPSYLSAVGTAVANKAPVSDTAQVQPITDMYGYIIDMAFRTNAADSNLLLQTEAVDRIYSTNENGVTPDGSEYSTMGGGSTMTFKSSSIDFDNEKVKELMKSVKIIFFDPTNNSNTVLATAKLDAANATVTADGVVANIVLYTMVAGETTYSPATAENIAAGQAGTVTLYTSSEVDGTTTYTAVADKSTITADGTYFVATTAAATEKLLTGEGEAVITALAQSQAQAVSVLVYLDGTTIDNGDVANGTESVKGVMNLQFASSANLTPMNYTELMEQGENADQGQGAGN